MIGWKEECFGLRGVVGGLIASRFDLGRWLKAEQGPAVGRSREMAPIEGERRDLLEKC